MKNFISYGKQWLDDSDLKAVEKVLKSDFLTQGPQVEEFEKKICEYTGAKYCVAVANGTAALHLAVMSLGIKKGGEGITSPNSFAASANCLLYSCLKPVFADIDSKTYNISFEKIKRKINKKTKLIVTVDFAGQPAEMEKIYDYAKKRGIYVIEDAAHAIGSKYENSLKVGSGKHADLTTFSFHPVKTITTGEGGAITTNNKKVYQKLRLLRTHGITKEPDLLSRNEGPWFYEMQALGYNYRLTDIQCALGLSQLKKINRFITRRRQIVKKYNQAFSKVPYLTIPFERENVFSAFHLYVLQIDFRKIGKSRAEIMEKLKKKGIGTQVHYIPIHLQPYYRKFGFKRGDYPVAEDYYKKTLSLPLYPKMTEREVDYVIKTVKAVTAF